MSWFIFALICLLGWGFADLFYKKSNNENDRYSHLRTAVWVGLIMGVTAFCLLPFTDTGFNPAALIINAAKYSPASLCYIISMVIGYAGLRYLELSIVSPVQNASGAFSAIFMFVYLSVTGAIGGFWDEFSWLDVIGTVIIVGGVIALAFVEKHLAKAEGALNLPKEERKYRFGALALLFPILYCIFDTIGTSADGIILTKKYGMDLGELDVIAIYGLTFFLAGICAWIFLWIKEKKPYNPFNARDLKTNFPAAIFEQFGQIFYVYAMAKKPLLAAPMVASYCIVSVILSRIFLKEKLKKSQYACVIAVIAGIVILGISEGIGEYANTYTDPVVEIAEAAYENEGDYGALDEAYQESISEELFSQMYVPMHGEVEVEGDDTEIDGDSATVTYTVTDEEENELCFSAEVEMDDDTLTIVSLSPVPAE